MNLYKQLRAIESAVQSNHVNRGYVLLVLPEKADHQLHNYIKQRLWPDLQVQCVTAKKLREFYTTTGGGNRFRPATDQTRRLSSYMRNCVLGMMVVNRKWAWKLADPLHYDVYLGIDVLNGMAGLTFVYNGGEQIYFSHHKCKQKEQLSSQQLRQILVDSLASTPSWRTTCGPYGSSTVGRHW